ncbi:hypothetical protein SADUNF_Sadunf16G0006900 [Salix dunnii]|uniref:Uncharacterized protein n=1 Tax=Salix dunnii TaxID=1413687 RepID=A0A835MFA7_9ROSI|nr:hypothetical protein SADUNF_Sadunf16G0006900 [Salix dunnii]
MVRKETLLVAFMASLLLVASFTICAHATEGRRMLASEKVVAAVSSSEGYHTAAVEKYAALALEERTAASGHNKTLLPNLIISYHLIPYVDTPRKNGVPSRTPIMEPKIWNLERDNDWVEMNRMCGTYLHHHKAAPGVERETLSLTSKDLTLLEEKDRVS